MAGAKSDFGRAQAADGPQGTEAAGDELTASEPWSVATASGGVWGLAMQVMLCGYAKSSCLNQAMSNWQAQE